MKPKIVIVVLVVVSVALVIALFATKKQSEERHASDINSISDFSNQVVNVNLKLSDANQVNLVLSNTLASSQEQLTQVSNQLTVVNGSLDAAKADLDKAQQQIGSLTNQVADLEAQNKTLEERTMELTNAIVKMNALISDTEAQLARANNNNAYLQAELQRQMAAKAELEHKFTDLVAMRAQVAKLKSDAFQARRLQWMKNDNSNKKGAELLIAPRQSQTEATAQPNYGLNVEIGSDGSVRVIPPGGAATNAPAK